MALQINRRLDIDIWSFYFLQTLGQRTSLDTWSNSLNTCSSPSLVACLTDDCFKDTSRRLLIVLFRHISLKDFSIFNYGLRQSARSNKIINNIHKVHLNHCQGLYSSKLRVKSLSDTWRLNMMYPILPIPMQETRQEMLMTKGKEKDRSSSGYFLRRGGGN